ncbi:MAG: hypothetical protein A3K19_03290 [Lentisphaerae bacterium RIFOXYB12_FULL_65_16]|nr:MAG: hypothetical protein A3K18_33085 [Lentisphaerae bacterium RIFOXYA12_64_32]OGV92200.1 MAG: hypothetical protein A3K19_03290 [Lentisphaerae bacterium RIFOXYB12_FULL_65_16]
MQDAAESVRMLETQWDHLAAEWVSLSAGWRDKAANTFHQTYWVDFSASMIASLSDLRESVKELERLAGDAETNMH